MGIIRRMPFFTHMMNPTTLPLLISKQLFTGITCLPVSLAYQTITVAMVEEIIPAKSCRNIKRMLN